jgi:hypothetical protein
MALQARQYEARLRVNNIAEYLSIRHRTKHRVHVPSNYSEHGPDVFHDGQ